MAMPSGPLILYLLLFLLPPFITAQTNGSIPLGSSLSTLKENTSWASPSGEFAFGFRRIADTDLYLLAIWFDRIPEKTIIWYLNPSSNDPTMEGGSEVNLTNDGQLILRDQKGQEVWSAATSSVSYAAMLDTGNFVLANGDSSYLWQSFDNPSDTLLPGQVLGTGNTLSSHQSDSNYSIGKFQLRLLNGDVVLNLIALPTRNSYDDYWTTTANTQGSGSRLIFNTSGYLQIEMQNGSSVNLSSGDTLSTQEFYQRVSLDPDGVLTQYVYPRNGPTGRWQLLWSAPEDICTSKVMEIGSGICGFNSYCILEGDGPACRCPPGYSYLDPNNTRNGCKPDFTMPNCGMNASEIEVRYRMQDLTMTNWPTSDYEQLTPVSEDECRKACLEDCLCAVAIFGPAGCWKKKLPLSNGRSPETSAMALIKVPISNSSLQSPPQEPYLSCPPQRKRDQSKLIVVGATLLGGSVFINLFLLPGIVLFFMFPYRKKLQRLHQDSDMEGANLHSYTYKELEEATDKFKEELGRGSFGAVYKGIFGANTRKFIAVKRLHKIVEDGEREFRTEMKAIGQTHHRNLVRLLGYCNEGEHRLLVYEFMSNGSLAEFLFGSRKPSWDQRMDIALGIARGLAYLHEECSSQIIHCDIKPQNILLDHCFNARISDFGLAKLLKTDQARTSTGIRGTKGYVAPEWFNNRRITAKVDVYGFGVLLLEIICCRKNVMFEMGFDEKEVLADWAYDCYVGKKMELLVEDDAEAKSDAARLERLVGIAIWCTQEDPSQRPTMKKVVQMLEGAIEVPASLDPSYISSHD